MFLEPQIEAMLVYRIEHKDTKNGPFQTDHPFLRKLAAFVSAPDNWMRFPNPFDDGIQIAYQPWFWKFGTASLETLLKWVSVGANTAENKEIYLQLEELGFVIRSFLVPDNDVCESRSGMQVLADVETARKEGLMEEMSFTQLLAVQNNEIPYYCFERLNFSKFTPDE